MYAVREIDEREEWEKPCVEFPDELYLNWRANEICSSIFTEIEDIFASGPSSVFSVLRQHLSQRTSCVRVPRKR